MRTPGGYAIIVDPGAKRLVQEFDTIKCPHCPGVSMTRGPNGNLEVLVFRADGSHYMKPAGFCRSCYRHTCPRCEGKPCDNHLRRIDEEEKAAKRFICV